MNRKRRGDQEGSPQAFLVVLVAVGATWFILSALRAGMWAAILVAFAGTNIIRVCWLEYKEGLLSTATKRRAAVFLGILFASFALLVWALPVAIEFSNTKP